MKKIILLLFIFTIFSCQQHKIAYVDNVKLMDAYQAKIDVENKFNSRAEALSKKRDSISQAFQIEAQAFQQKAQTMSQQKAQEAYSDMQQRGQVLGQQLQQEDTQLQRQGQTEMDSIVATVKREIKAYGKENGYTYILGGGEGGSVLYGDQTQDITDQLIKILNDKYSQ